MEVTCKFKLYNGTEVIEGFEFAIISAVFLIDGILIRACKSFTYGFEHTFFNMEKVLEQTKDKSLCLDVEYYDKFDNMVDLKRHEHVELCVSDEEWFDKEYDTEVMYLWLKPAVNSESFLWRL